MNARIARMFNVPRRLPRRTLTTHATSAARSPTPKMQGEDPRPPWVYVGTRLISFIVIPAIGVYSIFFYDFGEQEHVFRPIRRWAADGINSLFALSPAEKKLLHRGKQEAFDRNASERTSTA